MHRLKHPTLLLIKQLMGRLTTLSVITLFLWACNGGGNSNHHADRGESAPPETETPGTETPAPQEFGDVVLRLVQSQDDTSEPEDITPDTWSYHVNENEAAFDRLF